MATLVQKVARPLSYGGERGVIYPALAVRTERVADALKIAIEKSNIPARPVTVPVTR
jgi:hypothetical protein